MSLSTADHVCCDALLTTKLVLPILVLQEALQKLRGSAFPGRATEGRARAALAQRGLAAQQSVQQFPENYRHINLSPCAAAGGIAEAVGPSFPRRALGGPASAALARHGLAAR